MITASRQVSASSPATKLFAASGCTFLVGFREEGCSLVTDTLAEYGIIREGLVESIFFNIDPPFNDVSGAFNFTCGMSLFRAEGILIESDDNWKLGPESGVDSEANASCFCEWWPVRSIWKPPVYLLFSIVQFCKRRMHAAVRSPYVIFFCKDFLNIENFRSEWLNFFYAAKIPRVALVKILFASAVAVDHQFFYKTSRAIKSKPIEGVLKHWQDKYVSERQIPTKKDCNMAILFKIVGRSYLSCK